jgi:hypothetical protein
MRRIATLVGLSFGLVVILAPAALAKGAGEVVVSGVGLPGPIVIKGQPGSSSVGDFWELTGNTGVFDSGKQAAAPTGALGPRYRMDVYLMATERPHAIINLKTADHFVVWVYPYAAEGPWFDLPSRAATRAFGAVEGGWSLGSEQALSILFAKGLPRTSPVAIDTPPPAAGALPPAPANRSAQKPSGPSAAWRAVTVVGVVGILAAIAAVAIRRPRRARAAA